MSWWTRALRMLLPVHLFTLLSLSVVEPNDFWWHVQYGRIVATTHAVPDFDRMTLVNEGQRIIDQQWLGELGLYEAYAHGGLPLVILLHALVIAAGYTLVWSFVRRRVRPANAAVATVLAAAVGAAHWGVRTQTFSFLFFGVLVRILDEHATSARRWVLWLAVPLFALWTNVHGIYTLGWLAVGLHVGARCAQTVRASGLRALRSEASSIGAAVACFLAGAVNPRGPRGLIEDVTQYLKGVHFVGGLEFEPMNMHRVDAIIFLYATGRLVYSMLATGWRPPAARSAMLLVFGFFAMWVVRVEPWFGMLLLTPLAEGLDREDDTRKKEVRPAAPALAGVFVVGSLAVAFLALPWFRSWLPLPPSRRSLASVDTPFQATVALCTRFGHDRVFADQAFASYVEWACPGTHVFLDTRVASFNALAWEQYDAVIHARFDANRILDYWKVDALVLRSDQALALAGLDALGGWKEVYRDPIAVVLKRAAP